MHKTFDSFIHKKLMMKRRERDKIFRVKHCLHSSLSGFYGGFWNFIHLFWGFLPRTLIFIIKFFEQSWHIFERSMKNLALAINYAFQYTWSGIPENPAIYIRAIRALTMKVSCFQGRRFQICCRFSGGSCWKLVITPRKKYSVLKADPQLMNAAPIKNP